MSVYLSEAYVLSPAKAAEAWKPRICRHNLVNFSTIAADQEEANYPATNLANPATNLLWKSDGTAALNLTCLFSYNDPIDYVAFARHNFGSSGTSLSIETLDPGGDPEDDGDWTQQVAPQYLADDRAAIFFLDDVTCGGFRLPMTPDAIAPHCGVLMGGKSIALPYGLPPGHTPISMGRSAETYAGVSTAGDFLGSVELTANLRSTIEQRDLDADFYRNNLEELAMEGKRAHYFFAWSPQWRPSEVAFCKTVNDPRPVINQLNGEVDISFEIQGLAV